ncbi:hypothetical protein KCU99_g3272, partial [Aureobasidium melanogenum]
MAVPQDAWSSHIWTEQTLMRMIGSNQQQVEIRTNERMPQSFMVPQSLLRHYCSQLQPDLALPGQPFVLETSRPVLTLFFGWLYTGKVDSSDWHNLTELYFLGHAAGSVALKRSTITQLQKACRNDQSNRTELFHYGHISVIEEMVGASSPLSRYVEDTYFNHWSPEADCDGVNDDPSNYPKSSLFFKRLFQRSFKEQKEAESCSCCHDHCKYHGHESDAERLATCGLSSCPRPPAADIKPEAVVQKARKNKAAARTSLPGALTPDIDDFSSHETRTTTSRSATPKGKAAAGDTWLTVQSRAPPQYPAEYHGLLTSLPQVQSIKPLNWLEIGVEAEGVDQLPEPDRIIAAAMSWNAEDYAQTKCTFFNQYDATITNRQHWLNTLKFGGSKPKEKAERLLAMWESLGWLRSSEVVTNDRVQHPTFSITSASEPRSVADLTTMRPRLSFTGKWSEEERDAVATIMKSINTDESCARLNSIQRAGICNKRLESEYGYHRTDRAVEHQWYKIQQELAGATTVEAQDQAVLDKEQDLLEDTCKKPGSWPSQEQQALLEIMNALEKTHKDTTLIRRAEMCKPLLKSRCGTERTLAAISAQYHRLRSRREAVPSNNSTNAAVNDPAIDGVLPIILKTPLTTVGDGRNESAGSNDASRTASQFRWSDREDKAMLKVFKEIEEDSSLSILNEREKAKVCSARLLSKYNITRTPESIRGRCERLSSTSALKRKGDDDFDDHEPLMSRQKRRQTGSRFVAELFDAGED